MSDAPAPAIEPSDEAGRLDALRRLLVLDSPPDPVFDAITEAAAQACNSPIALVSLIDSDRQWFKSNIGLPGVHETPRDVAFCDHAIRGVKLFEVEDAQLDDRFCTNPLVVGDPRIRFYAGAPIVLKDGERVGTVCVIDRVARQLSEPQRAMLTSLSAIASAALESAASQATTSRALVVSESRYRAIVEEQSELISLAGPDRVLQFVNAAYARHFGVKASEMIDRDLLDFVDEADRENVRRLWQTVCGQTEPIHGVNRMLSSNGAERWVAWTNRPLTDAFGKVIAVQSVGRDITAQKHAERALAASEQRYRSLYEATPAIMHSLDEQGRLISVSNLWLEVMGYERHEVIGRRSSEFLTPDSQRKAIEQVLPEFFRTSSCENVEYQFVRKDGGVVDVLLSGTLERDAVGNPARSLAILQNVTANKRIANELVATHARLDAIVENVPAMLGYWDAHRCTEFVNRELQAAIGLPTEQIVGRTLEDVIDAIDPPSNLTLSPRVVAVLRGQRQDFDLAMVTTSGLRQLSATLIPDQPEPGRVTGFYAVAHDVTGLKALELRLSDSEARYRSLFDNLKSGFALHEIVVDASGKATDYRFLAMNAAFSAIIGVARETAVGRRVTDVLPGTERDPADWIGVFGRVALTGEAAHFEQWSAGLGQWFEVVAYRSAPGQFAVIATNITQRKAAEAALREAFREKETLLKEVYHRVKNNLQVVQSLLSLQRRSVPDEPSRAALDESVQRIRAMALVHEKLYQSGSLSAVSLADYTHDLLKQIGEATGAAQRGVLLKAQVHPVEIGLDLAIPFGLLVAELATNSMKHAFPSASTGELLVALTEEQGGLLLSVSDNGIGLPTGFDLGRCRSMGLQLATSLAEQLGGTLRACSGSGSDTKGGASFQVSLPGTFGQ